MSVRRLAEESVQPKAFAFSEENAGWAEAVIRKYPEGRQQSAVIPLLMRAQEQDGWVTKAAIEHVADKLRMPMIRVLEVATFYTQFQLKPVGRRAHVQVCGTTPCMLRGSDALKDVCRQHIHPEPFHLNESGTLSWEEVECLGACVNAPMVMIFKDTYEDLTGERLAEIIEAFDKGEGASVRKGPQIDRHLSVPASGLTTLNTFGDDDDVGDAGGTRPSSSAPVDGAATPSQAGRVDTNAAETDPRIEVPGKASASESRVAQTAETKGNPAEGAERQGSGETGGTKQGPTGQVERDEAEFGAASGSLDGKPRSDGPLADKGEAAESAVVDERKFVGDEKRTAPAGQDLSNRESGAKDTLDSERVGTSDTTEGGAPPKRPVGDDAGKLD
ncbi:NADH-quinone oxidoreductase subunit NuoE [Aureimonas pseudogalii]|uniref:NADH-quinone oxidoreductase subunit E n=1 Tax=Aureimonas pseudogalii TaxID=1744844 RepID=A0A7W6MK25_9HYPH|nr:NADH-quinone oxidoreductase subunit NuoE [Aureimonas pseudogalii]MBB3998774.1 NADH-quinone oxidoreductase subunit E [Aureimonas pseudogalii]